MREGSGEKGSGCGGEGGALLPFSLLGPGTTGTPLGG